MHPVRVDPERHEIDLLLEIAPELRGAQVLEVGCGDGRLTRLYAPLASRVLAVDPDGSRIETARALPAPRNVEYREAGIADMGPAPAAFDLAILAWSL